MKNKLSIFIILFSTLLSNTVKTNDAVSNVQNQQAEISDAEVHCITSIITMTVNSKDVSPAFILQVIIQCIDFLLTKKLTSQQSTEVITVLMNGARDLCAQESDDYKKIGYSLMAMAIGGSLMTIAQNTSNN